MPTFQSNAGFGVPNVPKTMPTVRSYMNGDTPMFEYPYSIAGTTKDNAGAALPACNVKLFRTADDSLVNQATSDGTGRYITPASNVLSHYVVAYLPGSPDVAGTSVNTLVGS